MTPQAIGIDEGGFVYKLFASASGGSLNFDFTTGVLPGAITFTRPSIGTYFNNAGTLITASSNVARFNYVAGVSNLLIEPAATNLLVQSNAFTTSWLNFNTSILTAAQFVSPDGTNNGWSATAGSGSGGPYQNIVYSNIPYTISVWAKWITLAGSVQCLLGAANPGIIAVTATLTRISGTATPPASTDIALIGTVNTGANTNGYYGAQLETGSVMTSYIPTTTAVTRAADSAVFTIPAGIGHLTYTFDDNSTQLVTVSAGSYTIPVTLNRPNIKSIVGSA